MEHIKHPELRREIGFLGTILGETIRELAGESTFTLEEIGNKFDLSRERVRQIKERAIRRLRKASYSEELRSYLD